MALRDLDILCLFVGNGSCGISDLSQSCPSEEHLSTSTVIIVPYYRFDSLSLENIDVAFSINVIGK